MKNDKKTMMENLAHEANDRGLFTGTWLYADHGEIVSKGAVGWRDPEDRLPMREDSLFDLASVSKNFTATAVMLLRKRGLLRLEDEITKFFPEIPYKGVTIRHLLNHTGGLPDYMDWITKAAEDENTIPGNEIIIRFLCECGEEPSFAPGDQFEYSNTGYCLLAQIVEKVSGVPFEAFMQQNVFEPAGMLSTRVIHRRRDRLAPENLAYGLVLSHGKYVLPDNTTDDGHCVVPLDGMNGDGIVHTNIFDLLCWDRACRNGTLLTDAEQEMMYTPGKLNSGEDSGKDDEGGAVGYGFGWDVFADEKLGRIVGHSGGWPGYSIWYERFLDSDRVLAILCCRESRDDRGAESFRAAMRAVARDQEPEPIRCIEDLALEHPDRIGWDDLCGIYAWRDYRIEVFLRDGDLYAAFHTETERDDDPSRLYPLRDKVFGIRGNSGDIRFGNDGLTFYGETGRKL